MAIPTTIESLSTTAASNGPSGSDQRTLADDGLRQAYAFVKQLVNKDADIASATTITPPSTGSVFAITGTTAITTIASTNSWDGRLIYLIFADALTFTHGSNLNLPGSTDITTGANDVAIMMQTSSGVWRCINYQIATEKVLSKDSGTYTPTLTNTTNIASSTANANTAYTRIGSVVHVSGTIQIDPTSASTATTIGISLPSASSLSSFTQLAGVASRFGGTSLENISTAITGDTTNDRAQFTFINDTDVAERTWAFSFQYIVV
jgi:hypothetical protein